VSRALVVGASLAGLRVAEALRAGGFGGELVVVGEEQHLPYNRPPLSKEALAGQVDLATLEYRRRASIADTRWLLGTAAVGADLAGRTVSLADGERVEYDGLAIATGLRARRLNLPGPIAGRHVIRTLEDALALRAELTPAARVVVIGAGFIGCEVASTARGLGCSVNVVAPEQVPMQRPLGLEIGAAMQRRHERHGVRFHLGRLPTALLPRAGAAGDSRAVGGVQLDDDSTVDADVVVEALGCQPNVEWLAGQPAGHRLDLTDGALTDNRMRAVTMDGEVVPSVVAAGDLARFANPRYDDVPRRVEHWSMPTDTGKRAGQTLAAAIVGSTSMTRCSCPCPRSGATSTPNGCSRSAHSGSPKSARSAGDPDATFVAEYLREGVRVGVLGIGLMPVLLGLRAELIAMPQPRSAERSVS
jgi:3-phenylpropionate/trans-cinnamate dioxygenase ferredoxin reductase subunit